MATIPCHWDLHCICIEPCITPCIAPCVELHQCHQRRRVSTRTVMRKIGVVGKWYMEGRRDREGCFPRCGRIVGQAGDFSPWRMPREASPTWFHLCGRKYRRADPLGRTAPQNQVRGDRAADALDLGTADWFTKADACANENKLSRARAGHLHARSLPLNCRSWECQRKLEGVSLRISFPATPAGEQRRMIVAKCREVEGRKWFKRTLGEKGKVGGWQWPAAGEKKTSRRRPCVDKGTKLHSALVSARPLLPPLGLALVAVVAERLACSPPTEAIRVQTPAGSLWIFARGNHTGRCRWSAGFLGNNPFPPPFHSDAAPYSTQSPSSDLKTSMLRAVQISSLTS
ncbi:hypothetical protein PR048_014807 [Dryococelus australis]|uniref:Uncharacterized protein n=1 Tax=Dryococelus australis TaxID=614101 RepID=A0ABQ9HG00_9NEOP|nr:hypothetical protein PR048_014807 [Dryococelus australis]